ncbi:hypothetical protein DSECCO2_604810 [anaerobic digester metagenome]
MLWVTNTTVLRCLFHSLSTSSSSLRLVCSSSDPKGSSMSNRSGSMANVRAMATLCFIPPESSFGMEWAKSSSPTIPRCFLATSSLSDLLPALTEKATF